MKVMMVSQGYPSEKYPMNGIHEFAYAKALKKQGIDVFVVALDMRSIRRIRKLGYEEKNIDGIRTYAYNMPVGGINAVLEGKFAKISMDKIYRKILKKEGEFHIIHSHFTDQSYAISKFNEKYHYPFIISEHSSSINKDNLSEISEDKIKIAKFAYNNCDELIVGSPFFRDRIKKNFNITAKVLPTVSETDLFTFKGEKNKKYENYKIVSTGNLKESKGHREVIKAFGKYMKDKNATLHIFGSGDDYNHLLELINSMDLKNKVFLRGHTNIKDIAHEYEDADLFVMASHSETYGKAYIEAMKSGLPVIATKNGGSEHLINSENGILVPIKDVDELGKGLIYMFNHRTKYDRLNISKYIEDNFSEIAATKKHIEVYKELLKR